MTLAAILFFGICFASVDPEVAGTMPQSDSAGSAPATVQQAPSNQTAPESTKPSSGKPPSKTPAKKPKGSSGNKNSHTQKVAPPGTTTCDAVPTNGSSAGSTPEPAPQPGSAEAPSTSEAPNDCPPANNKKKIVQQGGITEQSIQLAGNPTGDKPTHNKEATTQMLAATKENLKRIEARPLNTTEQDSVSQIHQFLDQSKTAVENGDLERAYTLAWKAQVLSDDMVSPKK